MSAGDSKTNAIFADSTGSSKYSLDQPGDILSKNLSNHKRHLLELIQVDKHRSREIDNPLGRKFTKKKTLKGNLENKNDEVDQIVLSN